MEESVTCPNCRAVVWLRRNYCPHCGRSTRSGWEEGLRLLVVTGLVFLMLPFGFVTACSAVIGFQTLGGSDEASPVFFAFSLVCALVTVVLAWAVAAVVRPPKPDA